MSDLTPDRITCAVPFQHTSVDLFGPYLVAVSRNVTEKRWGCIFTCCTTRAVHVAVGSQSTADFLLALREFCNLRGQPERLYSDQ
jgi:hypothetical protein